MATFTKIPDSETPSIRISPRDKVAKINDNIYGGFVEHMGRCIYGGLYDPDSPHADENGFRKDVIEAFKEIRPPVMRYPGGNFCATYHWLDGVGPRDKRPRRPELAWLSKYEPNTFGTDEFMKWCKIVGTEPYLCFNFGTGTLDEALAWLEYCNSTRDTYYANMRRQNGHEEPYNVKYWALGNEVWGPWQVEQMTHKDYAKRAYQWGKALKLLDPSIELVLCGKEGLTTWDSYVLKECIRWDTHALGGSLTASLISMHSIHLYTYSKEHYSNATAPRAAERAIQATSALIDLARVENKVPHTVPKQTICFDEWNVWSPTLAPGEDGAEQVYTLSDALAVAIWLNVFIRQAKDVGMANIAQSVNVISPLTTSKTGLLKQPTWWPLLLFSKYMRGHTIAVNVRCGEYEGPTEPEWIRGTIETPWLDVSAVLGDDGFVNVVIVSIHESSDFKVDLEGLSGGEVQTFKVTGDISATNDHENERIGMTEGSWDGKGPFGVTAHSINLLRWKA